MSALQKKITNADEAQRNYSADPDTGMWWDGKWGLHGKKKKEIKRGKLALSRKVQCQVKTWLSTSGV